MVSCACSTSFDFTFVGQLLNPFSRFCWIQASFLRTSKYIPLWPLRLYSVASAFTRSCQYWYDFMAFKVDAFGSYVALLYGAVREPSLTTLLQCLEYILQHIAKRSCRPHAYSPPNEPPWPCHDVFIMRLWFKLAIADQSLQLGWDYTVLVS